MYHLLFFYIFLYNKKTWSIMDEYDITNIQT